VNNPAGIFVDSNGNVYVDNGSSGKVTMWTPNATNSIDVMNVWEFLSIPTILSTAVLITDIQ
jgi:sugar lactone lactonase YvrE